MKERLNILIADDHKLVLEGFTRVLSEIPVVGLIQTANNGREAFDRIRANGTFDLVITDLEMPEMGGIELLTRLKQEFSDVKVLVLTMHNNAGLIREVIKLGADGYVLKSAGRDELEQALTALQSGRKHFEPTVTLELAREESSPALNNKLLDELTTREKEVLTLIARGYSNKNIADKLFISAKTVDTHRTNLMQKLDIHNTAGLTRFAVQAGLV